ncbi:MULTISPECIES: hypothetical protein [Empedobacter]|uniref:hypothetical protein n=1 Tax=Empedobacter TaxID=59734 RepID=UPI0025C62163|nr:MULTISPECIES: hypothetical protein [unclassified Empedobacter]
MKNIFLTVFIFLSSFSFAQEKTYRFLYDFHQVYETKNKQTDISAAVKEELNKSFELEVFANKNQSFIKLIDVVRNSQANFFLDIKPEPNWLLIDEASNLTYEKATNPNQNFKFLQDSIQRIQVLPTGQEKTILGIRAKEYKTETEKYDYTFWLGDFDGISASPIYFQFKDLVVVELKIIFKDVLENGNRREITYQLKDKKEAIFNFKKNIPKKYTTKKELDKLNSENQANSGVEKD